VGIEWMNMTEMFSYYNTGSLVRCKRGATAIEFALSAPVLFVVVMGAIELAMIMFVSALIEGGVREAARFGITGHSPSGISREDRIRQLVGEHTIGLIDIDSATITQHVYPSFGDVGKPEPFEDLNGNGVYDPGEPFQDINGNGQWDADMGVAGVGGPGDVVLYTVTARWATLAPLITPLLGVDGGIELTASVAVRNEPYDLLLAGGGGSP
jgi:hypothetical protein